MDTAVHYLESRLAIMEVYEENVVFSSSDDQKTHHSKWSCKVALVNFKKLQVVESSHQKTSRDCEEFSSSELLHAVAGLCSVCLPDMEVPAIYASLTAVGCKTAIILAKKEDVVIRRTKKGKSPKPSPAPTVLDKSGSGTISPGLDTSVDSNPFLDVISGGESSEEENGSGDDDEVDIFATGRDAFLIQARDRRALSDQQSLASVGVEHCVLGCAAFLRLANKPDCSAVQITLLAVRKSCRNMGMGRYLMQCCKDPQVVGHYDALLAFADPKAEGFYGRHGFSEDPLLTAKYRPIVDQWENSTLVIYVPPFSGAGLAVGSLKTLTDFQEHYKSWRHLAVDHYSTQLGIMERLRHELLLLHSKVQSQGDVISELTRELHEAKEAKAVLETEFNQYRKHSQRLLCEATIDGAQEWLRTTKQNKV